MVVGEEGEGEGERGVYWMDGVTSAGSSWKTFGEPVVVMIGWAFMASCRMVIVGGLDAGSHQRVDVSSAMASGGLL